MKRLKLTKAMTRHLLCAAVARTAWAIERRRLRGDGYTEPTSFSERNTICAD